MLVEGTFSGKHSATFTANSFLVHSLVALVHTFYVLGQVGTAPKKFLTNVTF